MYKKLIVIVSVIVLSISLLVTGDVSHLPEVSGDSQHRPQSPPVQVTEVCLGCICHAISGCNRTEVCTDDVCGLFRITHPYWVDSGKPVQLGDHPDSPDGYRRCVNEPYCAARSVQGYMNKFGQDCNGDGKINCLDHAAIHIHGGYGCKGPLPYKYGEEFDKCLKTVSQIRG